MWGELQGYEIAKTINLTYQTITKWQRNLFLVPTGKVGQDFIDEVAKTLTLFNSGSHMESVAITMIMIMFPLLLQKPSRKSKSKEHVKYLASRLSMWKAGQICKLVYKGRYCYPR